MYVDRKKTDGIAQGKDKILSMYMFVVGLLLNIFLKLLSCVSDQSQSPVL